MELRHVALMFRVDSLCGQTDLSPQPSSTVLCVALGKQGLPLWANDLSVS